MYIVEAKKEQLTKKRTYLLTDHGKSSSKKHFFVDIFFATVTRKTLEKNLH